MSVLNAPHFHDEEAAYAWVETRVWPDGPVCPHCGGVERISKMGGKSTRIGTYKCYQCRKPFTVKVGTIFEASHVPMHIWLQAMFLLCSSKKGISANQLHRTLGVTLKTAWFMAHRIREAMRNGALAPMSGNGGIVEADETYLWNKGREKRRSVTTSGRPFTKGGKSGPSNKRAIISLVERGGSVRSFHVENADKATVNIIISANLARETRLHTDESRIYGDAALHTGSREAVNHSAGEYARGDVHTNSAEGYFSIFKRGMKGVYQHCAERHLHRYLAEYDFRYNNRITLGVDDVERRNRPSRRRRQEADLRNNSCEVRSNGCQAQSWPLKEPEAARPKAPSRAVHRNRSEAWRGRNGRGIRAGVQEDCPAEEEGEIGFRRP